METKGQIREIIEETHDVKTFVIDLEESINFTAGQYCLVSTLTRKGFEDAEKPFTFVNAPNKRGNSTIELTIKKVGEFTGEMHSLQKGDKLKIQGPYGEELNFDESVQDDVIFLSGGSGITPFISALRYNIENNLQNKMILFFSNRTKEDIIYLEELRKMNKIDKIEVVNTLTKERPSKWEGETGRININMIKRHVSELKNKLWYICGPPAMVDALNNYLLELNIDESKIKWEDWQLPGKHD
ncbi:MAG: ferredoxin--NADP reductase [Candidatus Aenigmatarchaeota archaeon]